jgi:L-serine dehydratase
MANEKPSIFNDVLGPVMRGASSSHVGGAFRIAKLIRLAHGAAALDRVLCEFDTYGTQAATHVGHGSDFGFLCGMLGVELTDKRAAGIYEIAKTAKPDIEFAVVPMHEEDLTLHRVTVALKDGSSHCWDGVTSMGGGMVELTAYDGYKISMHGDYYELLLKAGEPEAGEDLLQHMQKVLKEQLHPDSISMSIAGSAATQAAWIAQKCGAASEGGPVLFEVRSCHPFDQAALQAVADALHPAEMLVIDAVLPTLSRAGLTVPFVTAEETLSYLKDHPMSFADAAALYEAERGGTTPEDSREKMREIMRVMKGGVEEGLAGTSYADRILGPQSHLIAQGEKKGRLVPDPVINRIVESVTAVMEVKSSYGVYVASPTGGSCGCLPGTLVGIAKALDLSDEVLLDGLLAAGLIGVYIAHFSCFGADVGACQVECGSAGAMAAAGIAAMMGGTPQECMDAAAFALHGATGLGCDPIGGRVEVPCLEKNIMCGVHALASANMALAGYDKVVPLDESIQAVANISEILPFQLKCSLECGLSVGCTSRRIEQELAARQAGTV